MSVLLSHQGEDQFVMKSEVTVEDQLLFNETMATLYLVTAVLIFALLSLSSLVQEGLSQEETHA